MKNFRVLSLAFIVSVRNLVSSGRSGLFHQSISSLSLTNIFWMLKLVGEGMVNESSEVPVSAGVCSPGSFSPSTGGGSGWF